MKKRSLIILVVILALSSTIAFAASVNGSFAGFPIVNVKVNNETLKPSVPGIVLQGSTLLPIRAVAESMNAVVTWDQATMTASITKPDINMCFAEDVVENADETWDLKNPYGLLDAGKNQTVLVYYEVGPMDKKTYDFKIIVKDPNGNIIRSSTQQSFEIGSIGMVGYIDVEDIDLSKAGNYKFEFQIKYGDEFKSVEDKILVVQ